jgi:hypothetical protein
MLAFGLALVGLFLVLGGYVSAGYQTRVGWVREQPVPFSHKHHVGDDGIDCRYCHTSVETSARAGLPATHICMTCHSQLWTGAPMLAPVRQSLASGRPLEWRRVAQLPDYVYFNHSIHISRGVPCVECHGRVDRMPLMARAKPFTMQFCLSCHRDPAPHLRPASQVTRMDWSGYTNREQRAFAAAAMRRHRIDPAKLDNCELCHR